MIRKTLNRQPIVSSLSSSGAHGPLGHNSASTLGRISRLRDGILPLAAPGIER